MYDNSELGKLEQRIALLENRETLIVLYVRDWLQARWKCIDIGDGIEITDDTWPKYHDCGNSQSGSDEPMWLGTATINRWADGWVATTNNPDGTTVSVTKRKDRDAAIKALREALNK